MKICFLVIFSAMILTPLSIQFFSRNQPIDSSGEKRQLAALPEFETSPAFARKFEAWFNDHYGLRRELISWNSKVKLEFFQAPINPEKVMIGKDGWLFYNGGNGDDYIFKSYTHQDLLNGKQLSAEVRRLERQKRYCDSLGIKYIRGFYPQTHTIYPEYLPFAMKIQIRDTMSKADQIITALRKRNSPVKFLDVRPALFKAKKQHQLYYKLDTHWNPYGAFIAYQELFNQSFDQLGVRPKSIKDFKVKWVESGEGDLVKMMAAEGMNFKDMVPIFTPVDTANKYKEIPVDASYPKDSHVTICEKCKDRRSVLMFRDSYTVNLIPFISPHFYKVTYLHWSFDIYRVKLYKPDIIIETPVERYMNVK
jgi:alginate O-acetyltransferase complex protein AlgJ